MIWLPRRSTLFPYTTLFRSYTPDLLDQLCISGEVVWGRLSPHPAFDDQERGRNGIHRRVRPTRSAPVALFLRSEEHTSELQSQSNLVCRLLLEKKKTLKDHY